MSSTKTEVLTKAAQQAGEQDDLLSLLAECRDAASRLAPGVADHLMLQAVGGPSEVPAYIEAVINELASRPAAVPDGFALVPVEPTPEMVKQGLERLFDKPRSTWEDCIEAMYASMLQAAQGKQ